MTPGTSSIFAALGIDPEEAEWQDFALCNGHELFRFYEGYESTPRIAKQTDQMCLSCPVQKMCLQAGIENKESGCWGGVYLSNGKMDHSKNLHKTEDIWNEIKKGLS